MIVIGSHGRAAARPGPDRERLGPGRSSRALPGDGGPVDGREGLIPFLGLGTDNVLGNDGGAHQLGTMSGSVADGRSVALAVPVQTT